jgi:hypothetical protein
MQETKHAEIKKLVEYPNSKRRDAINIQPSRMRENSGQIGRHSRPE